MKDKEQQWQKTVEQYFQRAEKQIADSVELYTLWKYFSKRRQRKILSNKIILTGCYQQTLNKGNSKGYILCWRIASPDRRSKMQKEIVSEKSSKYVDKTKQTLIL